MSDQMPPTSPPRARPVGVTIIAVLAAVNGALSLLAAATLMSVFGAVGGLGTMFFLLALVVGVVSLVFAYGAWTLQPWAWTLGVVLQVLGIVYALGQFFDGQASAVVSAALAAIILWYLFQPEVKAAFGRS